MNKNVASPTPESFQSAGMTRTRVLEIARQHMPPEYQVAFIMRDLGIRQSVDETCRLAVSLAAMQIGAMRDLRHPGVAGVISAVVRETLDTDDAKRIYIELLKAGTAQPQPH